MWMKPCVLTINREKKLIINWNIVVRKLYFKLSVCEISLASNQNSQINIYILGCNHAMQEKHLAVYTCSENN